MIRSYRVCVVGVLMLAATQSDLAVQAAGPFESRVATIALWGDADAAGSTTANDSVEFASFHGRSPAAAL